MIFAQWHDSLLFVRWYSTVAVREPEWGWHTVWDTKGRSAMADQPLVKLPDDFDGIELSIYRTYCRTHGEPFRAKWPAGHALFSLEGMHKLLPLEEFSAECGGTPETPMTPRGIMRALDKKPICCRIAAIDRNLLLEFYEKTGIGTSGTCQMCLKYQLGTPLNTTKKMYRHICFNCVVYRIQAGERHDPKV